MILVDTNIIIDIIRRDPSWGKWSMMQLHQARTVDSVVINPVIYAELCAKPEADFYVDEFLELGQFTVSDLSRPAARLAGKAYATYVQRGGSRTGVLPDFFIGAQAQAEGWTILTRDKARYKTYFPKVQLICP